jgi:hypothetical protein
LKCVTHPLVPVLAPDYKQHVLWPDKVITVCYSLAELCEICLYQFIWVEGGVKSMKRKFRNLWLSPLLVGIGVLTSGVKRLGREANHSLPYSAEVKNAWSHTSTLHTFAWRGASLSTREMLFYIIFSTYMMCMHFIQRCLTASRSRAC